VYAAILHDLQVCGTEADADCCMDYLMHCKRDNRDARYSLLGISLVAVTNTAVQITNKEATFIVTV
jgi:hypothetical protein